MGSLDKITWIIIASFGFLVSILIAWNAFLHYQLSKLQKNYSTIFSGAKARDLEELIKKQTQDLKVLDKDIQELFNISNQINNLSFRSLHKFGLVRFNPFKDLGGDQSFSIALLNGKNNGLVISSLHTKEGTRVYSKAIKAGKMDKYPLTEEEEEAIKIALTQETKKVL